MDLTTFKKRIEKLNLNNFDLIEAVYGAIGNINLESLGILNENSLNNNYLLAKQMLTSDAVVLKYLQLKQTFLIVIDNPNVEIKKEPISPIGIDGKFETHFNPSLPLIDDIGRVAEYWVTSQNNDWYVLHTKARAYKKRITQTIRNKDINSLNASMPVNAFYSFTPQFLSIRAQTLVDS